MTTPNGHATVGEKAALLDSSASALYVATDLESWITDEPHIWADKVTINHKQFIRLTPSVIAWLKQQVLRAEAACARGNLSLDQFGAIIDAFCPVYEFAVRAGMVRGPVGAKSPPEEAAITA